DRLRVVAEVLAGDSAREVEELAAVGVPHGRTFGSGDDEIGRRDPARHELLAPGVNGVDALRLLGLHCRKPYSLAFAAPKARRSQGRQGGFSMATVPDATKRHDA